jgi:predicted SAM-dependent methyltransferase
MSFLTSLKIGSREIGSYSRIQTLISGITRNARSQYAGVPSAKRYLKVGPGSNIDPRFVNVDWQWRPGIDVCLDISKGLHFPDARFDGIFTEHCLEHVSFDECVEVARNFFRILVPGGRLRVIVPDGGLYLDLYQKWKSGDHTPFPYLHAEGLRDLEADSRCGFTPMMAVNRIFRGYGHQFGYDYETLEHMLGYVGFVDIRHVSFREGADPVLLIDAEDRRPQSVYVECRKP